MVKVVSIISICFLLLGCDLTLSKNKHEEFNSHKKTEVAVSGVGMNIFLISPNRDSIRIKNLIDGCISKILLLRVPRYSCSSCVNREIIELCNLSNNNMNIKSVIITEYEDLRLFRAFATNILIKNISIYNCQIRLNKLDEQGNPYYLLINNRGELLKYFVIDKRDFRATDRFFNKYKLK